MRKSRVIVTLKEGVLDPQGQAIQRSLRQLGYSDVAGVRQGKVFELEFEDGLDPAQLSRMVTEIAGKVLSNPIIESFRIEEDS